MANQHNGHYNELFQNRKKLVDVKDVPTAVIKILRAESVNCS